MSTIFGLFYKSGKHVTGELDAMYSGMKHFPHEKHAFAIQGNCGFGHMLTYNTPEAVNEAMPKWNRDAQLLFAAEGRIDNREALFEALGVRAAERAGMPDGDVMLKAYLQWGEKCVNQLMGKWSFAAFHTNEQRLFLARDKWDYSDIQYYEDDSVFTFSTSEKGLFPLPFIRKDIDEQKIARLLIVWPGNFDKSYFKGIQRLLPSHTLRVTRKKTQLQRYWNYADIRVQSGLKLEDYVENLFDNLNQAVTARLRSYKPIAATLSGGMDSSTVCILAAEHLAKRGMRLRTYSHIPQFMPSGMLSNSQFGDEHPYVEAIVKAAGNIDPAYLDSAGISPLSGIREAIRLYGEPFHAASNAYWMVDIFKTAAKENYGTVLMGEFGNATTSRAGEEDALPAEEIRRRYGAIGLMKKKLLKPLLYGNTPAAHMYKRVAFGKRPWKGISYCTEAFESSLHVSEKMKESGFDPTFKRYDADPKSHVVKIMDVNVLRLPFGAAMGCETGLELRDPTGDPRVMESALAIPNGMFFGEMNKWVLRTMMKGRLPDMVRLNTKKGKQSSDITARLYAHHAEMDCVLDEMDASGFGRIVDIARIRADWERLKADCGSYPPNAVSQMLRPVAAFELYRTL